MATDIRDGVHLARKKIATELADARALPKATHQGKMLVGELELDCYVLEGGRRLFHKRGMAKALGMKSGGGNVFLKAVQRKGLGSEIKASLLKKIENPTVFKPPTQDLAHGYDAEVLVEICKAISRAEETGALHPRQGELAAQAKILLNAFAKVGVTALIDEATGFQQIRSPDALQLLVQQYVDEERREWEKQFPDEYYDELNRLYGSKRLTKTGSGAVIQNRPQHFAKFTRSDVYYPLENGKVLEELDRLNPKIDKKGTRKARLHQYLKKGYGIEKLQRQVNEIITLVKVSDTVTQFRNLFSKRFRDSGPLFEQAEKNRRKEDGSREGAVCRETYPRQSLEIEGRNILADAPRLGAKLPPLSGGVIQKPATVPDGAGFGASSILLIRPETGLGCLGCETGLTNSWEGLGPTCLVTTMVGGRHEANHFFGLR